jgi:hypothetical protein
MINEGLNECSREEKRQERRERWDEKGEVQRGDEESPHTQIWNEI